jgi:hypothetical protein
MKSISEKIIESFEKAGIKPERTITIPIKKILNSQHHKDVVEFLKKKKEFEERPLPNIIFKGLKPLELKERKENPNEIIEVHDNYRAIRGLPPEKITRREYEKRIDREDKKYHNWLIKFLKDKEKSEEYQRKHPSRIRFGAAYSSATYN